VLDRKIGVSGDAAPGFVLRAAVSFATSPVEATDSVITECLQTVGRIVPASVIGIERAYTVCRVLRPSGVGKQRSHPVGRVAVAGGVVIERLKTDGCVADTADSVAGTLCELEESVSTLSRVIEWIASVRWWRNRVHHWRQCKRCEGERQEKVPVPQ